MKKPDEKLVRALINLESNVMFKEIVDWVQESLVYQSVANNKLTGEATIKGQGRCLELEDLLKHIREARNYQQNLKESKRMEEN